MNHNEIIAIIVPLLLALHTWNVQKMKKIQSSIRELTKYAIEHEILMDWYCQTQGMKRDDLPTRHNGTLH